jgi:hypothetical protein
MKPTHLLFAFLAVISHLVAFGDTAPPTPPNAAEKSRDDLLAEARHALVEKKIEVPDPKNAAVIKQHEYTFVEFYEPKSSKILVRLYFDKSGQRHRLVDADASGGIPQIVQSIDLSPYATADALWDEIHHLITKGGPELKTWPQVFHATSEFLMRYPEEARRWEAKEIWFNHAPFLDEKLVEQFFVDVAKSADASRSIKESTLRWEERWRSHQKERP